MPTPGQPSGTQNFFLSNAELLFEAFDRIHVRPTEITTHHLISARRSLNLELIDWSNEGINLWEVVQAQLTLVPGNQLYTLPQNLVTILEMNFTTVNGNGSGLNSDRIMVPITRQQYMGIPNKLQPGLPTQYWLQRLAQPVVTLWQPPLQGTPAYVVNYNYLQRIQDAGIASGETPDNVYRGLEALTACVAKRLAKKFAPADIRQQIVAETTSDAAEAYGKFVTNDQEDGPIVIQPNVGTYGRMRR